MELKQGTLLQNGKYRIEQVLGQGGFGITYMAEQVKLHRKVAIKEFFMKEYCNRDEDTSQVSVPSVGSKELVSKFRQKFVKEAEMIASMENPHIVTIYEVFEENNTAYYVMQHIEGGSLNERVPMDASKAEKYIRQIADALRYCHSHKILHLDVKPSNVLVNKGNAILIDFGISKHYDESGSQTSSTPVGISKGYAPLEQYDRGDISKFGAATDIYSLGATLYKLLTGETPPDANYVHENGISISTAYPSHLRAAIIKSMESKRKDRPQSIDEFLSILDGKGSVSDGDKEITVIDDDPSPKPEPKVKPEPAPNPNPDSSPKPNKIWKVLMIVMIMIGVTGGYIVVENIQKKAEQERIEQERVEQERKEKEAAEQARLENERQEQALIAASKADKERAVQKDKQEYLGYIGEGDEYLSKNQYSSAINKYEIAQTYEAMYSATEYAKEFGKGSENKIKSARAAQKSYEAEQARLEKERKEQEAAEQARLEQERKEREAAEQARLEKERKEREQYANTHGSISGHEWVDLGLSVKWATCNVGADSPEDYGDYFAWGEVNKKASYKGENSKTYGKSSYNRDIGGDRSLDAASANWGGSWRLPTKAECEELKNKCTWKLTTQKGVSGYKVTGPNGNSIFLPAAGFRYGSSLRNAGERGDYWSSTPDESDSYYAYYLYFVSEYHYVDWCFRLNGQSVRPVSE